MEGKTVGLTLRLIFRVRRANVIIGFVYLLDHRKLPKVRLTHDGLNAYRYLRSPSRCFIGSSTRKVPVDGVR
jgi:hypothetical protein